MDNSVSVFSTLAAISAITLLAVKCVQDSCEQFEYADTDEMIKEMDDIMKSKQGFNPPTQERNTLPKGAQDKLAGAPLSGPQEDPMPKQTGLGECALMNVGGVSSDLATSLLPKGKNLWSTDECVPNALTNEAFLSPLDRIGANTVNRNMSHDLRGDLFCQPRINFPINNSSIECNSLVRPLSCFEGLERPAMYTCKGDF